MGLKTTVYIQDEYLSKWEALGRPSASVLVAESIENRHRDLLKAREPKPEETIDLDSAIIISDEERKVAHKAEQEREKELEKEKYKWETQKDTLILQAKQKFIQNGNKDARRVALEVCGYPPGAAEITQILMKGEDDAES